MNSFRQRFSDRLFAFGTFLRSTFRRYFDQPLAVFNAFVCQINRKSMPTRIGYGFCQPMIVHHPLYRQILNTNQVIRVHQLIAESVQEILALICDLVMCTLKLLSGLIPVIPQVMGTYNRISNVREGETPSHIRSQFISPPKRWKTSGLKVLKLD